MLMKFAGSDSSKMGKLHEHDTSNRIIIEKLNFLLACYAPRHIGIPKG